MARILVIDPNDDEVSALEEHLERAGYDVVAVADGEKGLRLARELRPDLVILDLGTRDVAGTEVARVVRADRALARTPLIMLSESGEEIDRVVGFEVGADDFVTKPFSYRELVLRVRAILRRRRRPDPVVTGMAQLGEIQLQPAAHRVSVRGQDVVLSALEFKLLTTLYQRRNRVQTRGELLEEVWGGADGVGLRTVDACIKRLRQKLGDAGSLVETVRGVGYRLLVTDTPERA